MDSTGEPKFTFVNFELFDGCHQMSRRTFEKIVQHSPLLTFLIFGHEGFQRPILDIDPFGMLHVNLEPYQIETKLFRSVVSCVLGQSKVPRHNSEFVRTAEALGFYSYLQEQIETVSKNSELANLDPCSDVKCIYLWITSTHVYDETIIKEGYTMVGSAFIGNRIVFYFRKPNPAYHP